MISMLEKQYIVRYPKGYALKFGERTAEKVADQEATRFDTQGEASLALLRCGLMTTPGRVNFEIETVDAATGERLAL